MMDADVLPDAELIRYRDEFAPSGLRQLSAIALVVAVTVLPEVFSWVGTPVEPATEFRLPQGRFHPRGGFLPRDDAARPTILRTAWSVVKRCFIILVATLGVLLYYPRAGFKRYALLCGPLIALLVPICVNVYLQARSEVFREEILVITLLALSPGVALYILLTWRKARRLGWAW